MSFTDIKLLFGDLTFLFGVYPLEAVSLFLFFLVVIDAVLPLTDGKFSLNA